MTINKTMTNKDYHANPAIGSSSLKAILVSPALYKYRAENEPEPNDGMKLGQAIHSWFLEPEKFDKEYSESTNRSGNTILSCVNDGYDLTPKLYEKFLVMQKALKDSEVAQEIIRNKLLIEASFFTDFNGVDIKCRPDLIEKGGWIVDVKTVSGMNDNPSAPDNFNRDFFDHGYDLQMFMYKNIVEKVTGKKFKGFKFIVVDAKEPVAGVNVYTFEEGSKWFEIGGHRFHEAIEIYKKCLETGKYYVYEKDQHDDLPLSYAAAEYYARVCEGEN